MWTLAIDAQLYCVKPEPLVRRMEPTKFNCRTDRWRHPPKGSSQLELLQRLPSASIGSGVRFLREIKLGPTFTPYTP